MKKNSTFLLWIMAIIIGLVPGLLAMLHGGSKNTVGKYYLATIVIIAVFWLVIKRITKSKKAI